jgi:glycine/D-amino acid oxidase-like deaminating enzyme
MPDARSVDCRHVQRGAARVIPSEHRIAGPTVSIVQRRDFLTILAGTAAATLPRPSYARPQALRIGVVGGGIVGAAIAMYLADAGARVTVFERAGPAMGATRNSFAWLNAFVADPHYRALRLASMATYRVHDRRLGLGIVWGGYLNWASDEIEAAVVRANAADLDGSSFPVRWLDGNEVALLSPQLVPGPIAAALYSAIDGHLDPVYVTRRFLERAVAGGAALRIPADVQALDFRRGRLAAAVTTAGRVPLDRLVVAAGVDTPSVLALAGFTLRLRHAPGILAHSAPLPALTRLVHEGPSDLSFKQMADGSIVGTDAPAPPDRPEHAMIRAGASDFPSEALRALHGNRILARIATVLPAARDARLERLTLGFRPMPPDDLPIVGPVPGAPDIYVSVTHSGVTLAPILGRYATRELIDGDPLDVLAPYRPARFSAEAANVPDAACARAAPCGAGSS